MILPPPSQPRPARADEADDVAGLVSGAYAHYVARIGRPPGPMLDDYARRIADGQVWVVEAAGQIIGLVVLEDDGEDGLLLDNIAVAKSAQGQGIGRHLMAFVEGEARRRGKAHIRLYTHVKMTENIALYRHIGFAETGRANEKGFDRVYMSKPVG